MEPKRAIAQAQPNDCPSIDPHSAAAAFPPGWSDCAFSFATQLSSLDQQQAHSRPSSITQTLRNLRFMMDSGGLPTITDTNDPKGRNLLLYTQGSEYADSVTEAKPYALEISSSGEILNVRKMQHGQDITCSSTEAFLQLTLVDKRLSLRFCSSNTIYSEFDLEKGKLFQWPF
jgi:hypothetical protein